MKLKGPTNNLLNMELLKAADRDAVFITIIYSYHRLTSCSPAPSLGLSPPVGLQGGI